MKTFLVSLVILTMTITLVSGQNHPPVAVNDTVYGFAGYPVYVNLLKNDYDPDGDPIFYLSGNYLTRINDSTWEYQVQSQMYPAIQSTNYVIKDSNNAVANAKFIFILKSPPRYDFLDVNNIAALISPYGNHFWDGESARFEVPKGSGKTAVFNSALWIGGQDTADSLHFAGERYRQGPSNYPAGSGADYFTGPISSVYDSAYQLKWNRVWKLTRAEILYHKNNWNTPAYTPIDAIANWPANGDPTLGQMDTIAPFYDINLDGIYSPETGEYPLIRGDEAVFFVFNDVAGAHTETLGPKMGIEIHGMAYAFDRPEDSVLNNTIFFNYSIINRSSANYHESYMGVFTDFDLGYASDDYIGCDVTNGAIYIYNGKQIDGSGQSWAYGEHPPVVAMKIIGGPFLDPDNLDNPSGGCDYSINGMNFGNDIVDDERYGLQGFIYYNNTSVGYTGDPALADEYYNYLKGLWLDESHLLFGGNGHAPAGTVGTECKYMFPGGSDTICNWGTGGIMPPGGFNQNGYYWTETTSFNQPEDRRGIASIGPFTIAAGQSIPLDYCFMYSRDYTGNQQSSLELMQNRLETMKPLLGDIIRLPETINGTDDHADFKLIRIYPNPAQESINVISTEIKANPYQVYDLNGRLYLNGMLNPGKNRLNISSLSPGVYLLKCNNQFTRIVVL
jgi:hypothetical protein